jgi:hypothetical protein
LHNPLAKNPLLNFFQKPAALVEIEPLGEIDLHLWIENLSFAYLGLA